MEVQAECAEPPAAPPPCDPQPTGKINKAAFKLFGKRRSGSGMASFFSFRNKGAVSGNGNNSNSGNGNSVNGSGLSTSEELVRSKTHDGLTGANNDVERQAGEALGSQEAGPVRSLSKSLSFFSLLRRGSLRAADSGGAGLARRGRGLKGLFSSIRWRRKDKTQEGGGDVAEAQQAKELEVEVARPIVTDITLILEPPPHQQSQQHHPDDGGEDDDTRGALGAELGRQEAETSAATAAPLHCVAATDVGGRETDSPFPSTPTDSPLRTPSAAAKAKTSVSSFSPSLASTPPLERCSAADPPSEPSVDRLCSLLFTDVTSLKSFDSLTGCGDIIADAEDEGASANGGSGTSSSSSGGGGGGGKTGGGVPSRGSPSKPPLPPQLAFPAAPCPAPVPLPARAQLPPHPPPPTAPPPPPAQQQQPAGSGVVAYMGGGEEMASPEGVDDADMQGLWHMLPSTGDNSPALPRTHPAPAAASNPPAGGHHHYHHHHHHHPAASRSTERKVAQVKSLGLSKIPVVGGAGPGAGAVAGAGARAAKPPLPPAHPRHATSPGDKEPLSDEGYWDTPSATPTATPDDGGLQRGKKIALSRDSCSGDHLYDLYTDPEEEREEEDAEDEEEEDLTSSPSPCMEYKLSPPSQATPPSSSSSSSFRSMKGSTSLPRDSKIPVSVRQTTPPHSVSQSALSSVLEAEGLPPKSQELPPVRTRIPVSKVPIRRPGIKPGNTGRGSTHK